MIFKYLAISKRASKQLSFFFSFFLRSIWFPHGPRGGADNLFSLWLFATRYSGQSPSLVAKIHYIVDKIFYLFRRIKSSVDISIIVVAHDRRFSSRDRLFSPLLLKMSHSTATIPPTTADKIPTQKRNFQIMKIHE